MCMFQSLVRFSLFESPFKNLIITKLGLKMQKGFLYMLIRSKVMYQGEDSSEVRRKCKIFLGGKCKICTCIIFVKS